MGSNSKISKEFKEAQKRAAKRRAALNEALGYNDVTGSEGKVSSNKKNSPKPANLDKPSLPRESPKYVHFLLFLHRGASIFFPIFTTLAAFLVVWGVVASTPLVSGSWDWTGLSLILISLLFIYLAALVYRSAGVFSKIASAVVSLLIIVFAAGGALTQVVVDGEAQLAGSTLDKAQRINELIVEDMFTLEDNQKLLELPLEQARGIIPLYEKAINDNLVIAATWNPAIASDLPAPGYLTVYQKVNAAADLQASALSLFLSNMEQYDNARQERIVLSRSEVTSLLSGPEGAATILNSTSSSLGLSLDLTRKSNG